MAKDRVIYGAPDKAEDSEMIYGLLSMDFGDGLARACRNGRIAQSHLDWRVSRIGLSGDKLVTFWGVYDLQMRIGSARVRTAGINLPMTHPDYRGHGLMSETIALSTHAAARQGYGLSVINNTHGYFLRFGYVFAWPETHFTIKTSDLPDGLPSVRVEETNAYDLMGRKDLAKIYNRDNNSVTGTTVRPTYRRSKHPGLDWETGYLFSDEKERVAGYLLDGPPESGQLYYHSDSAGDADERLRVLKMLACRHGCDGVYFHRLPFTSDLAIRLRHLNCDMDTEYRNDRGYLIRIINLATTLKAMAGELSERLKLSHLAAWRGELFIRADDQQATLLIDRSEVRVTAEDRTPHRLEGNQHVSQLLIGTYRPLETVRAADITLNGDAVELIEVLFPAQWPQMPNEDL